MKFTLFIAVISSFLSGCMQPRELSVLQQQQRNIESTLRSARLERLKLECEDCQRGPSPASCVIGGDMSCDVFGIKQE